MRDGAKVAYIGNPRNGLEVGDEGVVLDAGKSGSHVRWISGARVNEIDLIRNSLLVEGASVDFHPVTAAAADLDEWDEMTFEGAYDGEEDDAEWMFG